MLARLPVLFSIPFTPGGEYEAYFVFATLAVSFVILYFLSRWWDDK